jgi:uncharacterized membrane protein
LWSDGDPLEWAIPVSWRVNEIERLDASISPIFGGKVLIGPAPVLFAASVGSP